LRRPQGQRQSPAVLGHESLNLLRAVWERKNNRLRPSRGRYGCTKEVLAQIEVPD